MIKRFLVGCLIWGWVGIAFGFPALTGPVVDEAHLFTPQGKQELINLLQKDSRHQVVIVTVPTLNGQDIFDYNDRLLRQWGINDKNINNAVFLILAPREHQSAFKIFGLTQTLTENVANDILSDLKPLFKAGEWDTAARLGAERILSVIQNEAPTRHVKEEQAGTPDNPLLIVLITGLAVIGSVIFIFTAPPRERWDRFYFLLKLFVILLHPRGRGLAEKGSSGFKGKGGHFGGGGASRNF